MTSEPLDLLLADDDIDDRQFFKEALEELPISALLNTVEDGEQLMKLLTAKPGRLPDILFLDLNMPRKTGIECLAEIKLNEKLKHLPVIIFSTSLDPHVVSSLHEKGARHYIRKPADFSKLKTVILRALDTVSKEGHSITSKEDFIIQG